MPVPSNEDLALVRQHLRTRERQRFYSYARNQLPVLLRKTYPHIYKLLMGEFKKDDEEINRVAETLLFSLSHDQVVRTAERIRQMKAYQKEKRGRKRFETSTNPI